MKGSKNVAMKHAEWALVYFLYLLFVWITYRALFEFPELLDQFFVKPVLWLAPVAYLAHKEGSKAKSLGLTTENLFPSFYLALLLGAAFALEGILINFSKYGQPLFLANVGEGLFINLFVISFIAAVIEEIAFRGYIYSRLTGAMNIWVANILSSTMWAIIYLPVYAFSTTMNSTDLLIWFVLLFTFGVGSAILFERTKNIFSSVLLHIFWLWPIILFR